MSIVFLPKINSNFFFIFLRSFKIIFKLNESAHDQLTDLIYNLNNFCLTLEEDTPDSHCNPIMKTLNFRTVHDVFFTVVFTLEINVRRRISLKW